MVGSSWKPTGRKTDNPSYTARPRNAVPAPVPQRSQALRGSPEAAQGTAGGGAAHVLPRAAWLRRTWGGVGRWGVGRWGVVLVVNFIRVGVKF